MPFENMYMPKDSVINLDLKLHVRLKKCCNKLHIYHPTCKVIRGWNYNYLLYNRHYQNVQCFFIEILIYVFGKQLVKNAYMWIIVMLNSWAAYKYIENTFLFFPAQKNILTFDTRSLIMEFSFRLTCLKDIKIPGIYTDKSYRAISLPFSMVTRMCRHQNCDFRGYTKSV